MSDTFNWSNYYDAQGEYCGPKWLVDPEVYVSWDEVNYVRSHYKWGDSYYDEEVYLEPAGAPEPTPVTGGPVRPVCPSPR